ncbi:relaxase domain-containing protein, partial [Escherichia coli]|nr:relaxase domain-containing protein [Escherichia coli]
MNGKLANPETGEIQNLADNSKGEDRRAGMDFTVSPSKSVSIAGLVGKDDRVVAAHLQANTRAMAWLEK